MFTETQQITYFYSALEALFPKSKVSVVCLADAESFSIQIDDQFYTAEISNEDDWFGFAHTGSVDPVFAIPAAPFWG